MCPASEQKATCSCMKLILVKYWNYSQRSFKVYLPFTGWNGTSRINTQAKDRVLIPHGKAHGCQDVPPCWQQRTCGLHCSCSAHPSAPSNCGSAGTDSRGRTKSKGLLQSEHGNGEKQAGRGCLGTSAAGSLSMLCHTIEFSTANGLLQINVDKLFLGVGPFASKY